MTANFVTDESLLVDSIGISMPVTASVQLPQGTHGFIVAGVDEQGTVRFPCVDNSGSLSVKSVSRVPNLVDGFISIQTTWETLKTIVARKRLSIQYVDETTRYQVFAIDSSILYMTTLYVGVVPQGENQAQNDANRIEFENVYEHVSNRPTDQLERDRNITVASDYYVEEIMSSSYHMLVDLDNPNGSYRHTYVSDFSTGVKMTGIHAVIVKNQSTDKWLSQLGIVLTTSPLSSSISWLRLGTQNVRDTGIFQDEIEMPFFPTFSDLTVVGSGSMAKLSRVASNNVEVTTQLTSTTPILDAGGNTVFVNCGDVVLNTKRISGDGTLLVHYHMWYFVD